MPNTTYYNFPTPADTDLVKDGASAIRSLGNAVDTTTKALNPSTTLGDIEYRSSTANTNTRLGIGSTGNVLTVAGGVPSWAAPAPGGGMTLISETVASAVSSLTFGSIAGTYKQLHLVWSGIRHSTSGGRYDIRLNNNSGSVYAVQMICSLGTSLSTQMELRTAITGGSARAFGDSANGGELRLDVSGYLIIDNYASATKAKTFYGSSNYYNNDSGNFNSTNAYTGVFNSTTAVTSIDIVQVSGGGTFSNTGDTTIRLYGVA
jgi:hypothetical protein